MDAPDDTLSLTERFIRLSPERVFEEVEVLGRRCTGRYLILNSYENRVYNFEMEEGLDVVGKFYRPERWTRAAIEDEHRLTREWHERITGSPDPLRDNPLLARSLRNRYPYLDPLHVMQVDLLRRQRDGGPDAPDLELVQRGIQLTLNAIATGIRNSG